MTGPAPTYAELQMTVTFMFALLVILSCLALEPIDRSRRPKGAAEPFCPLHKIPRDQCTDQHDTEGDPQ